MEFINRDGQPIQVDPFDQQSITAAKAAAPGEGVGPLVASELLQRIADGTVTNAHQLPAEYQHVGTAAGLRTDREKTMDEHELEDGKWYLVSYEGAELSIVPRPCSRISRRVGVHPVLQIAQVENGHERVHGAAAPACPSMHQRAADVVRYTPYH